MIENKTIQEMSDRLNRFQNEVLLADSNRSNVQESDIEKFEVYMNKMDVFLKEYGVKTEPITIWDRFSAAWSAFKNPCSY